MLSVPGLDTGALTGNSHETLCWDISMSDRGVLGRDCYDRMGIKNESCGQTLGFRDFEYGSLLSFLPSRPALLEFLRWLWKMADCIKF